MRTVTKTEKLLLGLTALFLCVLAVLFFHDRSSAQSAAVTVETARAAAQEDVLGDLTPLNLNTATAEELETLPGIGEELARRILAYRTERGGFESIEELLNISGIGEKKLEDLRQRVTVEETT